MKSMIVPFSIKNGRVESTTDPAVAAEGKIVTTLVTSSGERTGAPKFGANIMQLLFEAMDPLVFADFRVEASQELKSRISSIDILNITIEADPAFGDNVAKVSVVYRLPLSNPQVVSFKIVVPATLTEETIL